MTIHPTARHLTPQPVQWLWQDRIALGHLTLLEGEPGIGTTLLALLLAAYTSSARPFPTTTTCPAFGSVLLLAPHCHPTDTLLPRFLAAYGEATRLVLLDTIPQDDPALPDCPFTLPEHFTQFEAAITCSGATLVILDPLSSLLTHNSGPKRLAILRRLSAIAQRTHSAIVLVHHLTSTPALSPRGSLRLGPRPHDLLASVSNSLLLLADESDPEQRLLLSTKHTLSPKPSPLAFHILTRADGTPTLDCLGESPLPSSSFSPTHEVLSAQRIAMLGFLGDEEKPLDAHTLATATHQGYEATRKLLQRMVKDGELVTAAQGIYTTPGHPCLARYNTPPIATPTPVPQSPTVVTDFQQSIVTPTLVPQSPTAATDFQQSIALPTPIPQSPTPASDPEPPAPFYMPGTSPSECTPYISIWEKATTPPFTHTPPPIDDPFPPCASTHPTSPMTTATISTTTPVSGRPIQTHQSIMSGSQTNTPLTDRLL